MLLLIDLEQELADYNGDDENEGEFEADKQAVLSQDWGIKNPRAAFPPWKWRDWLVCVIKTSWICSFLQCCWMPVSCLTALETARSSTAGTTGEGSSVNRRHKHSWNVLFFSFVNFFRFICGMKSFREHQIVRIKACFRLHFPPQHTETQPASEWVFTLYFRPFSV